jgi:ABC-type sugar transport system substrate-binding protein
MKKTTLMLLAMILVLSILALNGCNGVSPSSTARPGPETTSKEAPEVTSKEAPEVTSKTNYEGLLAWYYPFPHPFGEACKAGIDAYVRDTGIPVKVLIGPEFTMTSEIESVEALMGQGYKHYGIFSVDAAAANGLYEEMVAKGCTVNNIGWDSAPDSAASHLIATDIGKAAEMQLEYLAELMGHEGNIAIVYEALEDIAIQQRRAAVDKVMSKYPDMKVELELSDMKTVEASTIKIQDGLSAKAGSIDGIAALGFTCSQALVNVLSDLYQQGADKMFVVTIDSDDMIDNAIKNGIIDATCVQNPYGIGYISGEVFRLQADGWRPKEGKYHIDTGAIMADKTNIDNMGAIFEALTKQIMDTLTTEYMKKD